MARKRDNDRPTPEELREILLAYIDQDDPTELHGERRQKAFGELMDAGLSDREALAVLDDVIGVLRATRTGAEGTPLPRLDGQVEPPQRTNNPVIRIVEDEMGGPLQVGFRSQGGDDDDGPVTTLAGLETPEDVEQYVKANSSRWSIDEAEQARDWLEDNGGASGDYAEAYNQLFLDHDDLMSGDFDGEPVTRDGDAPPQSEQVASSGVDLTELSGASPAEAAEWWLENGDSLTDDELEEVEAHFTMLQASGSAEAPAWAQLVTSVQAVREDTAPNAGATPAGEGAQAEVDADEAEQVEAATAKAAEIWGRSTPGVKPDFSSVEEMLPDGVALDTVLDEGYDQALATKASEEQQRTGSTEDEALVVAQGGMAERSLFEASEPDWLLQVNGGMLSEQQKRRYVDYWNDAYGTTLRDFEELAPILARFDGTEDEAQNFAKAVLVAQEPLISQAITLPLVQGERKATYTEEEMADLRSMGYSNDAITRLVRLSAITGGEDAIRPGAMGDTIRVGALAMLGRYFGAGDEYARQDQNQDEMAQLEQQLGMQPGEFSRMTFQQREELRASYERKARSARARPGSDGFSPFDDEIAALAKLESMGRGSAMREDRGPLPGILAANNNFKRGLEMYRGDEFLSFVHAVDPALAQRVASTPTADDLDWRDNAAVYDILERAGAIEGSNTRLRQLEDARGFFGYFAAGGGRGGGGGGAGPVRRLIDPVATKQAVQQLWSRMFLADVSDATVQAITADLQKQLDAAPEGMSFDVSARIEAFLKGQDVYDELYRNKPEGLSEEEYQAQMAAGVGDMLGNELDPEALKAGLRTGQYQTAVGRAAQSSALIDNSTLRGRWAQAKQTLDKFS